jgi:hypothetical protein
MKLSDIAPLNELFQTPVPYRWVEKSERNWEGTFDVNGLTFDLFFSYQYSLSQKGKRVFTFDFVQDDDMHNTGRAGNSSVRVFATVVVMLAEFLSKIKPTEVILHGKNGEKDSLYSKMARALRGTAQKLGYEVSLTSDASEYKTFHIRQMKTASPI